MDRTTVNARCIVEQTVITDCVAGTGFNFNPIMHK